MIAWLSGTILEIEEERMIVVVQDLGYELTCTRAAVVDKSPGDHVELFVYPHTTEHSTEWFGFHSTLEKAIFGKLISVQGVGPKVAMSILSTFGMKECVRLITSGQDKALTSATGVGKKIAQRLVMELRETLLPYREQFTHSMEIVLPAGARAVDVSMLDRALSGLRNMGYRPQELSVVAGPLHEAAEQGAPAADLIRLGLALLRKEKP